MARRPRGVFGKRAWSPPAAELGSRNKEQGTRNKELWCLGIFVRYTTDPFPHYSHTVQGSRIKEQGTRTKIKIKRKSNTNTKHEQEEQEEGFRELPFPPPKEGLMPRAAQHRPQKAGLRAILVCMCACVNEAGAHTESMACCSLVRTFLGTFATRRPYISMHCIKRPIADLSQRYRCIFCIFVNYIAALSAKKGIHGQE